MFVPILTGVEQLRRGRQGKESSAGLTWEDHRRARWEREMRHVLHRHPQPKATVSSAQMHKLKNMGDIVSERH